MRTIIIAGVYGHTDALYRLLLKCGLDTANDCLILNGDMIDYGPDSYGTWRYIWDLKDLMQDRWIYLIGSHEQLFMDAELLTRGQIANALIWRQNGGKETIRSFEKAGKSPARAAVWIKDNTRTWYEDLDFIVAHGDIRSQKVWDNNMDTFIWGTQALEANDYSGKLTILGRVPMEMPTYFDGSGHRYAPKLRYDTWYSLPKNGAIGINTGADAGGLLTAMIIENRNMYFVGEEV